MSHGQLPQIDKTTFVHSLHVVGVMVHETAVADAGAAALVVHGGDHKPVDLGESQRKPCKR